MKCPSCGGTFLTKESNYCSNKVDKEHNHTVCPLCDYCIDCDQIDSNPIVELDSENFDKAIRAAYGRLVNEFGGSKYFTLYQLQLFERIDDPIFEYANGDSVEDKRKAYKMFIEEFIMPSDRKQALKYYMDRYNSQGGN